MRNYLPDNPALLVAAAASLLALVCLCIEALVRARRAGRLPSA